MHIDVPAVVVKKRIANQLHIIHVSEKIKERIARRGNQKFVAGIAEQAEDKRVSFAGAGGQEQIVDSYAFAAFGIVITHCLPGRFQALWDQGDIAAMPERRANA